MPRVLFIAMQEVEELELVAPMDLLRRAGAEVVLATICEEPHLTGRNGIRIVPDCSLSDLTDLHAYDALVFPGGPGVKHLRADKRCSTLAREAHAQGRLVAAICAAPTLLLDAGLLPSRRHTAHPSVASELPGCLSDPVVLDDRVLTSRGAGTALHFGLALVRTLFDDPTAEKIARSICA
jgi:4-methyl-5(b-hydroxyethyl)-thiazole monophosphate biosynthesis